MAQSADECQTLTIPQVARILGVSNQSVYKAARAGRLPGAKPVSSRWVVVRDTFETWLATP